MLELKTLLLESRAGCLNNEKGLKRGGHFCLWIDPCRGWDRVSGRSQDVSNNGHIPDRWDQQSGERGACMHAGRPQFHRTQVARPDSHGTISRTSVSHSVPVSCLKAMADIRLLGSGPRAGQQAALQHVDCLGRCPAVYGGPLMRRVYTEKSVHGAPEAMKTP
jgi:hypothetical protein